MAPSSSPHQEDDDEDDIDPIKILLPPDDDDDEEDKVQSLMQHNDRHYICIPSIGSTIIIRQLPSQGLSFQLWPAANTLVTLLDCHRSNSITSKLFPILSSFSSKSNGRPLNVLELGSGTGLVGIATAVTLGAHVTVTDLPHVIPNLQFNVDANANTIALQGGRVNVSALTWGEEGESDVVGITEKDFDLILASDVVYHDHLYEPLLYTLRSLTGVAKKIVFLMAHLRRWKKDSVFFKRAKKWFDVEVFHVDAPCQGSRIGVVVYSFVRKQGPKT